VNSAVSGGLQRQEVLAGSHDELGVSIAIVVKVRVVAPPLRVSIPLFLRIKSIIPCEKGEPG